MIFVSTVTRSPSCATVIVCLMSGGMLWLRLWSSSHVPVKLGRAGAAAMTTEAASRMAEQGSAVLSLIGGSSFRHFEKYFSTVAALGFAVSFETTNIRSAETSTIGTTGMKP
jgi:hypothetical protein